MTPGDSAEVTRTYTPEDLAAFAALAGGAVPQTVPEPLIAALFSCLLGVDLPGFGTNYLKQSLTFAAPVPVGTPLTARVQITRLRPEKHLVDLETTARLPDGTLVCEGRALVLARDAAA